MVLSHVGEISALATAFCWSITALMFESASRKVGSIAVNLIRIILAFLFLAIFNYFRSGSLLPINADNHNWIWLLLSGLVGFVVGDMFLFESYTIIGARVSALIMTTVPLMTAFIGFLIMKESMSLISLSGMMLTVTGIFIVLFKRDNVRNKFHLSHSKRGITYALIGAVGQSAGLVLSKYGIKNYDPFMATQIRTIAGIFGFAIIVLFLKRWHRVGDSLNNKPALGRIVFGAFFVFFSRRFVIIIFYSAYKYRYCFNDNGYGSCSYYSTCNNFPEAKSYCQGNYWVCYKCSRRIIVFYNINGITAFLSCG